MGADVGGPLSTPAKTRIAVLICAFFIVWPGLHRIVVAAYDINPWRFGGFAMYATPPARLHVAIIERLPEARARILSEREMSATVLAQQQWFQLRRSSLGSLLSPADLAAAYFAAGPGVDEIEIVIIREMLSAASARIERQEFRYPFQRPSASRP